MTPDRFRAARLSPHAVAASANRLAYPGALRTSGAANDHYARVWRSFGGRNGFFGAVDVWLYKSHDGVWRAYTFAEDYDTIVEPALAEKALAAQNMR
jgi:hypothetical protein